MLLAFDIGNTTFATGGFAELVGPDIPAISAVEPHLVLEGLRILYERNR
jgi:pantothenate kinase type III